MLHDISDVTAYFPNNTKTISYCRIDQSDDGGNGREDIAPFGKQLFAFALGETITDRVQSAFAEETHVWLYIVR